MNTKLLPVRRRQAGAVIITVCLMLLFLLGFMGFAVDFTRAFVVKTELQTAMDSCALAAAQELDLQPSVNGGPSAIDRAISAGKTARNLNAVVFQSADWSGEDQLVNAEITFKDADYVATTDPTVAQYVECKHTQSGMRTWLLHAFRPFFGNTTDYPNSLDVMASAVATRAHGQTTCPIPVALKPKETCGGTCPKPDYGFTPGEWVTMLTEQSEFNGGQIGWMSLIEEDNGASAIKEQLNGYCGTKVKDELHPSDGGSMVALVEPWNYRFGVYKKLPDFNTDPSYMRPDFSGFAYNATSWPGEPSAWSDFVIRRANNASCASDVDNCLSSTGDTVKNPFKDMASSTNHGAWGSNRRLVMVPVIDASNKVIDFACMFMLAPLAIPMSDTKLEYIGNASLKTSPCSSSGMPGGGAGLVPALVR